MFPCQFAFTLVSLTPQVFYFLLCPFLPTLRGGNDALHVLFSQKLLDYEVDSDDEWEEEEPGESLSHSEGVSADLE